MTECIHLWIFPEIDFADWRKMVGDATVADHAGYMAMIAAIQADQERQGREVVRVGMRVASMDSALAAKNLENTPDNRAAIVAREPAMIERREWRFDFGLTAGYLGRDVTDLDCDELLEVIIAWAVDRGHIIGGGFGPTDEK